MRKLFLFFAAAMIMLSCNAQEPKTANAEAVSFATENKMSEDVKAKFYDISNKLDETTVTLEALGKEYQTTKDDARKEAIVAEYETKAGKLMDYLKQVVKENRDNIIPAFFARSLMYELEFDELKEFCAEGTGYYNHPNMAAPKQLYAGLKKRAPGSKFSDIEENDLQGKAHKLSEYVGKGNYVLVDFWASWCGPCRAEMPNVKAAYDKYHAKGFEIVGLSFDQNKDAWEKAVKDLDLNWIHLSDLKGWQSIAGSTYGVMSIPASILVGPDGVIVAEGLRGEALGAKLAEIYGE